MFSKRHEQELADIKTMTKELGERLQIVVDRIDRITEQEQPKAGGTAETTADAPDSAAAAEAVGDTRTARRAKREAARGRSGDRKARRATRRARAAQQGAGTAEAAENGGEPATPSAQGDEPGKLRQPGRSRKTKTRADEATDVGGTAAEPVRKDAPSAGEGAA